LIAAAKDNYPRDGMTHSYVASFAEIEADVEARSWPLRKACGSRERDDRGGLARERRAGVRTGRRCRQAWYASVYPGFEDQVAKDKRENRFKTA